MTTLSWRQGGAWRYHRKIMHAFSCIPVDVNANACIIIPIKHALLAQGMRQMDRKRLARIAYIAAADRLLARCEAGTLSREAGRDKLAALRRAYDKRVADIELGAFLNAHGLGFVTEFSGLDASLAHMAAEHAAGTVGGVELARVA